MFKKLTPDLMIYFLADVAGVFILKYIDIFNDIFSRRCCGCITERTRKQTLREDIPLRRISSLFKISGGKTGHIWGEKFNDEF